MTPRANVRPRRRAVPSDECGRPCLTPRGYPRRSVDCRCDIFLSQKNRALQFEGTIESGGPSMPEDRAIPLSKLLISMRILFIAQPSRAARTCYDSFSLFASAAPAKESSYSFSTSPTQRLSTPGIRWSGSASRDDHSLGARTRARGPLFVLARRQALALP
jgi:hypothetical protein